MPLKLKHYLPAIILFIFFASLYIYTAAPGVYDGDSGELATVVKQMGLAHPTGFPLYILTGKLFTLIFHFGDTAYRLNIFSGLLTAFAIVFLFYTLLNLNFSLSSSFITSIIFGVGSNTIWSNATTTRVYALSLLCVATLFFIFSKWKKNPETKYIYFYGFIWGLSLGVHFLDVVMIVPLLFMIWNKRRFVNLSSIIKLFLIITATLFQYILLFIDYKRNTLINWGDLSNFNGFIYYITQRQYSGKFFSNNIFNFLWKFISLNISEFGIVFWLVGIAGLVLVYKYKKDITAFLIVALMNFIVMLIYGNNHDLVILSRYLYVYYFVFAIFIAFGIDRLLVLIENRIILMLFILLFLILIHFRTTYADNNLRSNNIIEDTSRNIFKTIEPNSILITYGDVLTNTLLYLQSQHIREDVVVVDASSVVYDWYVKGLISKYPNLFSLELLNTQSDGERLVNVVNQNYSSRSVYSIIFSSSSSSTVNQKLQFIPNGLVFRVFPASYGDFEKPNLRSIWENYNLSEVKPYVYKNLMISDLIKYYALASYFNGVAAYKFGSKDDAIYFMETSLKFFPDNEVVKTDLDRLMQVQ